MPTHSPFISAKVATSPARPPALRKWLDGHPLDGEAVLELGLTHEQRGDRAAAGLLYRSAVANEGIPNDQRAAIARELRRLGVSPDPDPTARPESDPAPTPPELVGHRSIECSVFV